MKGRGGAPFFPFLIPTGWDADVLAGYSIAIMENSVETNVEGTTHG